MSQSVKVELRANVVVLGKGRDTKSIVLVMMGNLQLAKACLGGRYSPEQALTELKRQPQRFTLLNGETGKTVLRSQGITVPEVAQAA